MNSNLSPKTYVLAIGQEIRLDITGVFFVVTDATAPVSIAWDDQGEYVPYQAGTGYQLDSGEKFKLLRVRNDSGAPNTVTIFYGTGRFIDSRKAISIDAASITAIGAAVNTPVVLKPICENLAISSTKTFSGMKSIEVIASGTGTVNVTSASGSMNFNIAAGFSEEWSCENDTSHFEDITVTTGGASTAQISGTKV
jgi:hypothetical protein